MDGPLNAGTKTASGCSPTKCVFAVVLRTVCGPEHVTDVHSSGGGDGTAPKANKREAAPLGPKHGATTEPVGEVPRLGQSELGEGLPRGGGAFVTATESQNVHTQLIYSEEVTVTWEVFVRTGCLILCVCACGVHVCMCVYSVLLLQYRKTLANDAFT